MTIRLSAADERERGQKIIDLERAGLHDVAEAFRRLSADRYCTAYAIISRISYTQHEEYKHHRRMPNTPR